MSLRDWLRSRLGLEALDHLIEKKSVPVHRHTFWYYWGGMTLFLFGVQVVTGILLVLYYRPSADEAYESVRFLMTQVSFGWLVRSIHSWSANLMIGAAMIHMFSTFLLKAYRGPREATWLTGMALFVLALAFGFSGYLLPWNQLAFFATKVGTDIIGAVPGIGVFLLRLLRGGDQITGGTLTRFYGFHVAVLPLLMTAVLGVHLYLVQWHGMSVPPGIEEQARPARQMRFVPDFLLRDIVGWLAALGALALLAALFPWELGLKADPYAPAPAGIKPEWYFGWMFQTLRMLPSRILGVEGELLGILGFGLAGLVWALVPFLDTADGRGPRARVWSLVGMLALLYVIVFTLLVYRGGHA
ncbi:MAG TPA: cytochrome bc complex cytochrome b subunit [Terriglobales bacterium]|nr:cytochrome bc complex cytochrome b subunit [Terriglobales bacterium]